MCNPLAGLLYVKADFAVGQRAGRQAACKAGCRHQEQGTLAGLLCVKADLRQLAATAGQQKGSGWARRTGHTRKASNRPATLRVALPPLSCRQLQLPAERAAPTNSNPASSTRLQHEPRRVLVQHSKGELFGAPVPATRW